MGNKINGFANSFYGWGGEDDDLYNRLKKYEISVKRYPANISRIKMLKHNSSEENPDLKEMMKKSESEKLLSEGVSTVKYQLSDIKKNKLFTKIIVILPTPPPKV